MRFHYAFQKIVDLKGNEKAQAEWMLSAAIGELKAQEQNLHQLLQKRDEIGHSLQQAAQKSTPISEMCRLQSYAEYLDTLIEQKNTDIEQAHSNVKHKQGKLTEKMLDEKVWMKAREKSLEKFRHESLLREQNELDELATVRYTVQSR
ncbi:flagellar export protein FliJ [Paenibacillus sp. F411]|uniref:Flagellar FliJ protein n=1 Tax=Paenibacillus algicola TaxID=2565926 RepID=A0A4P8XNQ7_9BACL|nr:MULTISPECIES: flagellar export protein FliJ [Paenibacillus]MBO2945755.1 flagellar export protein FliJ [Paenibacillus sp. F411]QCT03221.1 flagellar export protein FliJ [Paenibacillus algicola]